MPGEQRKDKHVITRPDLTQPGETCRVGERFTTGFRLGERVEHISNPGTVGVVGPIAIWRPDCMWPRFAAAPRPEAVPVHWPHSVDRWERPEDLRRVAR